MHATNQLPNSAPEAEGIPSAAILGFVQAAEDKALGLHSLMLLRHGCVVASGWWSPYAAEHSHMLFSLSKSFTSTGVGLAVSAGLLSVDDPVISFFPDDLPDPVSPNLAAIRVRHLLTMTTGHTKDTMGPLHQSEDGNWAKAFLACPVEREPGTHFLYNTGATYMLSAIVQKVTGQTLMDYLQPRLFEPLGIEGAAWETCPRGINTGGFGLSVRTEDIARFGQLYLQKGLWRGQRIVPATWIEQATTYQTPNGGDKPNPNSDWHQGYGYQFWRCRHNVYRGDGAFGQFCIVMPEQEAVLAITAGSPSMQGVLDLVWEHLLPAMGPAPLAADPAALDRLHAKLASLVLPPVAGEPSSPWAAKVAGRRYLFPENVEGLESVSFDFSARLLVARQRGIESRLTWGKGNWAKEQRSTLHAPYERLVAVSGAWSSPDTFKLAICSYETPCCGTITCRFAGDEMTYDLAANVSFGPTQAPTLTGRAEPAN